MISAQPLSSYLASLAGTTPADPTLRQKVNAVIAKDLAENLDGVVIGWKPAHVEKLAFPFQVAKQGRIFGERAATQLAENKTRALSLVANPDVTKMILHDVETALNPSPSAPPTHDVNDPEFRTFHEAVRTAAQRTSNFTCRATLVNVGWGAGDHENVNSSNCPAGPKTTAAHLANQITAIIFQP